MGVDYVVDLSCPVKAALTTEGLINLVKRRNQANTILSLARRDGDTSPPSAIFVRLSRPTPHGETHEDVSAQTLLDESAPLNELESHCAGCPANAQRRAFGCLGAIHYPIDGAAEQWIMNRLPDVPGDASGQLPDSTIVVDTNAASVGETRRRLLRSMEDVDGTLIAEMRRHRMFFERNQPVMRRWRVGLLRRWSLTSNQVLKMMIGPDALPPDHCTVLALLLSGIPLDSPVERVFNPETRRQTLIEARLGAEQGGPDVRPWIAFLNAITTAAAIDVPLLIDR